jgi:hypothetical protein
MGKEGLREEWPPRGLLGVKARPVKGRGVLYQWGQLGGGAVYRQR